MSESQSLPFVFSDTTPQSITPAASPGDYAPRQTRNPNRFSAVPAAYAPPFASQPATTSSTLNALHAMQGIIRIENATFTMTDPNGQSSSTNGPDNAQPVPLTTSPLNADIMQKIDNLLQEVSNLNDVSATRAQALQDATNAMRDHTTHQRYTTDVLTNVQTQQSSCYRIINTLVQEMNWMSYQINRLLSAHYAQPSAYSSSHFPFPMNSAQERDSDAESSTSNSSAFTDGELLQLSDMKFDDHGYLINYRTGPTDNDSNA
ncbi:hypothetical protein CVT24_013364 [Panaeolus cyanescens]|uniref:Uncharacterized protein n=1 Tax=Panaeolus cyanescens TaxID=181874 RepID=A0A409YML5_9AGAR|nr:hypothetical protein CVT24_013364 [Panaeolus cyanescens]